MTHKKFEYSTVCFLCLHECHQVTDYQNVMASLLDEQLNKWGSDGWELVHVVRHKTKVQSPDVYGDIPVVLNFQGIFKREV